MEKTLNAAIDANTSDNDGTEDDVVQTNSLHEATIAEEPPGTSEIIISAAPTQSESQSKVATDEKNLQKSSHGFLSGDRQDATGGKTPSSSRIRVPRSTKGGQSTGGGKDETSKPSSSHSVAAALSVPSASLQKTLETESAIQKLKTIDFLYYEAHNTAHALELTGYGWSSEFSGKKKKKKNKK